MSTETTITVIYETPETDFAEIIETESIETEPAETETTVSTADSSNLSGIDVNMLNTFTYLGTAFILAFFFFFVCKGVYKLFNMFF